MSGTRSHSRAAPAIEPETRPVLLIVSHGERGGARDDRFAYGLVERLRGAAGFADVQACFLSKEPSLKTVSAALPPGPVVIYPLFMADGYFVNKAIPRQLPSHEDRDLTVLTPLGLNPRLPGLVAQLAVDAARAAGVDKATHELLLAAHGSKHEPASRLATEHLAERLRQQHVFAGVSVSFLEEAPFVSDQLAAITRPVIVAGLFAGQGMHGAGDVPQAVQASGRGDVVLAPQLVSSPVLAELVVAQIEEHFRPQRQLEQA
jgi:sirohydrochlorin ferrochelatase